MTNGIRTSNIESYFEKSTEGIKGIEKGISIYHINNSISRSISRPHYFFSFLNIYRLMKYQSVSVITKVNDWTWRHSLPVPLSRKEWNCRRMKETNISEMDNIFAFALHGHYTLMDFCLFQKLMLTIIIFVFYFVSWTIILKWNTILDQCYFALEKKNSFDYLIFLYSI